MTKKEFMEYLNKFDDNEEVVVNVKYDMSGDLLTDRTVYTIVEDNKGNIFQKAIRDEKYNPNSREWEKA